MAVPWNQARIDLDANNLGVAQILEEFGRQQGIPLTVGEKVGGNVSGSFYDVEAESFLDALCDAHQLVWFFDGAQLYVVRVQDLLTRHLLVSNVTAEEYREVMWALGFASGPQGKGASIRSGNRKGFLILAGAPSFVEMGEVLVRDLDNQETKRLKEEIVTRQFRLKYASASDITLDSGSSTTEIAGVARILQEMLGVDTGGHLSTGDARYDNPSRLLSHRSAGLTAAYGNLTDANRQEYLRPYGLGNQQGSTQPEDETEENAGFEPSITANSRLNAVIVRDAVGRMPLYEELIAQLDVPTQMIEIRASIVDVDADNTKSFSTEFLGNYVNSNGDTIRFGNDADRGLFDGTDTQGQLPSFVDGTDLVRGVGGRVSTILTGTNWEILARVKALEEKGYAQLVTSPMVLTEENRAANIRFDETVYVRLVGERDVDLTEVTTGTQLRVTPTVIEKNGVVEFSLQVEIIDGSFRDEAVDQIPTTQESAITTRAMVPDSRTLLLGGNFVERQFNNKRQIPILGDIPIAGRLFGARERQHSRAQRFFFLTPRLVDIQADSTAFEREAPEEIPGGNMDLTRQLPLPYMSPTRVEDHARHLDRELTAPLVPGELGDMPEDLNLYVPLPPPLDFKLGKHPERVPHTQKAEEPEATAIPAPLKLDTDGP